MHSAFRMSPTYAISAVVMLAFAAGPITAAPIDNSYISRRAASLAPAIGEDGTRVLMRNVDFYVDPEVVLHIRQLHGTMRSKSGGPVNFDDKHSLILHINSAEIGLDAHGLTALLNKYIFGYKGAPIKNASVSIDNGQMRMTGSMHKGINIPFDITAQVLLTPDGMMRIHPVKTRILKLNGATLMKVFNLSLEKLLDVSKAVGVTVQKNDIIIDPAKVLPPPTIEGRVIAVRVEGDQIVQTFGGSASVSLTPPAPHVRNFMYFRGGSLRFGKLTMADAEMLVADLDPSDPLKFDLDLYAKQLVAGYSRTLPSMGSRCTCETSTSSARQDQRCTERLCQRSVTSRRSTPSGFLVNWRRVRTRRFSAPVHREDSCEHQCATDDLGRRQRLAEEDDSEKGRNGSNTEQSDGCRRCRETAERVSDAEVAADL